MAASRALIDFGLPTNNGMTMCGNTTTSLNGNNGSWMGSEGSNKSPGMVDLQIVFVISYKVRIHLIWVCFAQKQG
jgi:hypothetical protein